MSELSELINEGGKRMSDMVTSVLGVIFKLVFLFFILGIIVGCIATIYFLQ